MKIFKGAGVYPAWIIYFILYFYIVQNSTGWTGIDSVVGFFSRNGIFAGLFFVLAGGFMYGVTTLVPIYLYGNRPH